MNDLAGDLAGCFHSLERDVLASPTFRLPPLRAGAVFFCFFSSRLYARVFLSGSDAEILPTC
jgi:hypothetical protein